MVRTRFEGNKKAPLGAFEYGRDPSPSPLAAAGQRLAITQREISQIIGRSRESTNKQLRVWAKRGWIRLERGGVSVLAPDKLAAAAAEGSEFDAS